MASREYHYSPHSLSSLLAPCCCRCNPFARFIARLFLIRSWRSRTVACPSGREWEFPLRSDIQLCRSINFDERKNACFLSRRFRLYILPDRRNLNCSTFLKIFSKNFEKEKSPEKMNSQGTVFYFVLFIALHISSNFLRIFLSFLTIALCVL